MQMERMIQLKETEWMNTKPRYWDSFQILTCTDKKEEIEKGNGSQYGMKVHRRPGYQYVEKIDFKYIKIAKKDAI